MQNNLDQHVLVLNKNWVVIGTTTVKNGIILLCRNSAKVLCPTNFMVYTWSEWISKDTNLPKVDNYIRTPNLEVPAPSVLILTNYSDIHVTEVSFSPRSVYKRDNFTCQYCLKKKKLEDLSIDHVLPKSKQGKTTWENCVTACFTCNNKKANRTPKEAGLVLRTKPSRPKWTPVIHLKDKPESWKPLLKDSWL